MADAIKDAGATGKVKLAMDIAASEFYNKEERGVQCISNDCGPISAEMGRKRPTTWALRRGTGPLESGS